LRATHLGRTLRPTPPRAKLATRLPAAILLPPIGLLTAARTGGTLASLASPATHGLPAIAQTPEQRACLRALHPAPASVHPSAAPSTLSAMTPLRRGIRRSSLTRAFQAIQSSPQLLEPLTQAREFLLDTRARGARATIFLRTSIALRPRRRDLIGTHRLPRPPALLSRQQGRNREGEKGQGGPHHGRLRVVFRSTAPPRHCCEAVRGANYVQGSIRPRSEALLTSQDCTRTRPAP